MKTRGENPKESLGKDPEKDKQKISRWKNSEGNPSVGRPASRSPTVRFLTVRDSGRPVIRPFIPTREQSSLSIDRDQTESKALAIGRSNGRPKYTQSVTPQSRRYRDVMETYIREVKTRSRVR